MDLFVVCVRSGCLLVPGKERSSRPADADCTAPTSHFMPETNLVKSCSNEVYVDGSSVGKKPTELVYIFSPQQSRGAYAFPVAGAPVPWENLMACDVFLLQGSAPASLAQAVLIVAQGSCCWGMPHSQKSEESSDDLPDLKSFTDSESPGSSQSTSCSPSPLQDSQHCQQHLLSPKLPSELVVLRLVGPGRRRGQPGAGREGHPVGMVVRAAENSEVTDQGPRIHTHTL